MINSKILYDQPFDLARGGVSLFTYPYLNAGAPVQGGV